MPQPITAEERPSRLELVGLHKSLGGTQVLRGIDLVVEGGEFVSLLGPSGCGKTTTLNIIAGFLDPDAGEVSIDGRPVTALPPHRRNLAMVFQNYSLFPHMTVFDNVAFGLTMRGVSKADTAERVREALELVRLPSIEQRYPRQLSGGQQQRVGLARALAVHPRVLLLDEPLSNLDAKLRKAMQTELRRIQQRVRITTIYVTHDQEEALTLSDRIAVMNAGAIEQVGPPERIYSHPATEFVAGFIGESSALDGVVAESRPGGSLVVRLPAAGGRLLEARSDRPLVTGQAVRVLVRPDRVALEPTPSDDGRSLAGRVTARAFVGSFIRCVVDLGGGESTLLAHVPVHQGAGIKVGEIAAVRVRPADWLLLPDQAPATSGAAR